MELPKVMQRFLAENNLLHEHDGKGMNILTQQLCGGPSS
jgi:hypothetical protein